MPIVRSRFSSRPVAGASRRWLYAAIVVMLLATLTPQPGPASGHDFFAPPQPNPVSALRDVVQNVLLFMPFGVLLGRRRVSILRAGWSAAGVSLVIELVQFVIPGRDPVALDVLTNAAGGVGGAWIAGTSVGARLDRLLITLDDYVSIGCRPAPRVATSLARAWSLIVVIVSVGTGWLLTPSLPPPVFYGVASQYPDAASGETRLGGGVDGFHGRMDEVRLYARARSAGEILADMTRPLDGSPPSDPALVAAYAFDVDESDVAAESSGRGLPASLHQATWTAEGRFGGALVFHGESSRVALPDVVASQLRRALTLQAWVYPTTSPDDEAPLIFLPGAAYYLQAASDVGEFVPSAGGRFGGLPRTVTPRRRLSPNRWTHLATTFDGSVMRIYLDGQLAASRSHWSPHSLVGATLNGADLPIGPLADPGSLPPTLTAAFDLRISITCGELQSMAAPMFVIGGIQSVDALSIDASGAEVRVRYPTRASRLGLVSPPARFPHALSGCAPQQRMTLGVTGPLQRAQLNDPQGRAFDGLLLDLAAGWMTLVDSSALPPRAVALISLMYLAGLVFPYGFWFRLTVPTLVGALILAAGLAAVPWLWEMRPLDANGLLAIATGIVLGRATAWIGQARSGATSRAGRGRS